MPNLKNNWRQAAADEFQRSTLGKDYTPTKGTALIEIVDSSPRYLETLRLNEDLSRYPDPTRVATGYMKKFDAMRNENLIGRSFAVDHRRVRMTGVMESPIRINHFHFLTACHPTLIASFEALSQRMRDPEWMGENFRPGATYHIKKITRDPLCVYRYFLKTINSEADLSRLIWPYEFAPTSFAKQEWVRDRRWLR